MDHPTSLLLSALAGAVFLTALTIGVVIAAQSRSHRRLDMGSMSHRWLTAHADRRRAA